MIAKPLKTRLARHGRRHQNKGSRRGAMAVLAMFCLPVVLAFVAFAVDTGQMSLAKSRLQNAVDAAALAASQEIVGAIEEAGLEGEYGDPIIDANSIAVSNAKAIAVEVAAANGVYVDPEQDVTFGKRSYNSETGDWPITWGEEPYNVVKVTARRDQPNTCEPDGQLPLLFGWAVGKPSVSLTASASGFLEARDLVVVLDFSASMNDDTEFFPYGHDNPLSKSVITSAQNAMWDALVAADPQWPDTGASKFPADGFGRLNKYKGRTKVKISSNPKQYVYFKDLTDSDYILTLLKLDKVDSNGDPLYPFPQSGAYSDGTPKDSPSAATSESRWKNYIRYVRDYPSSHSHYRRYGYRTLMDYLQHDKPRNTQSEDLWRTPHYPFHGIKEGCSLFLDFLTDLDFGDQVGLVTYDSTARVETSVQTEEGSVDISADPITGDYAAVDALQTSKQAGHYDVWTGMGYGIEDARELLRPESQGGYARYGARKTILLMTDGNANKRPSNWSLPDGWDWGDYTDFNGDGNADYTTSDKSKQYAFWEAVQAINSGIVIHTMTVGADADADLMEAIAFAGGGVWIDVPGGTTIAEMQGQLLTAFSQIASKVPPGKLVYDDASD